MWAWLLLPPGWCHLERSALSAWERWLLQYGEWLSTENLAAVPSVLSPEPPTPDSPQASLIHFALPLLEPRVSDYKWNFVGWSFKRLWVSSVLTPANRNSAAFHSCLLSGFLSSSSAVGWGAQLGVYTSHFLGQPSWLLNYPSGTSSAVHGSPASPLTTTLHSLPDLL